jgi:hypothetical protein
MSFSIHSICRAGALDALLATQAGLALTAQTVLDLAFTRRTSAGQGHPPGTSPYERQTRDMHKNLSRSACDALAAAVTIGNGGRQA